MNEALVPIAMFAAIFAVVYVFLTTRHKERLALIEKGADASLFNPIRKGGSPTLKFGMLFVGIAIGILLGSILDKTTLLPTEVGYFSMIFLCGGISLIAFYMVEKKILKEG